jgi:hypothetical protein
MAQNTNHQIQLSLDKALMRLAGQDTDKLKRKIRTLEKQLYFARDEVRKLKPDAEKGRKIQDFEQKHKKMTRNAEIILREANRTIRVLEGLKKRNLGSLLELSRAWVPSDLIEARRALKNALRKK